MTELTDEEIEETSKLIGETLEIFCNMGLTNMDQLNMCHTCGYMIVKCTCENCQCNMHKEYRKKGGTHSHSSVMGKI